MRVSPRGRPLVAAAFVLLLFLVAVPWAGADGARGGGGTRNQAHRLGISYDDEGIRIAPIGPGPPLWECGISLDRYGPPGDRRRAGSALATVGAGRIEYHRGAVLEWYRATLDGIDQGLEIQDSDDAELLQFDYAISGALTPKVSQDGQTVEFKDPSGSSVLVSRDLRGLDAQGREAPAHWERIEPREGPVDRLRLVVDGTGLAFPLRVTGLLVAPRGSSLVAPTNDQCGAAMVVPGTGPFPYLSPIIDITDATTAGDPPVPSCQSYLSRSVWFAFTPVTTAGYTFSVCSGAPTATTVEDTVLAIYSATGACSGLSEVGGGCDDDSCGVAALQSIIDNVTLTAGTTYYVVAWSYGTAAPPPGGGSLQLQLVQQTPPGSAPANDRCDGAELIPASGPFPYVTSVTADMSGATSSGDPPAPSCQPSVSRSIWYSFTPASSGPYSFSTCADCPTGSTVDDTVLALYSSTAACSGLLEVPGGCDDDSCVVETGQSRIEDVGLSAGATYYLVVWQYGNSAPAAGNTAVQVQVRRLVAPPNDTCAAAANLALDAPVSGTTQSAADDTQLPAGSACFPGVGQTPSTAAGGDVTYRFTAPADGKYSFRVGGYEPGRNAVLYVSSDCPAGAPPTTPTACLAAANRTTASSEEVTCLPMTSGQTVYVYADEDASTGGGAFTMEATRCPQETEPNGDPPGSGELACGLEGSIIPTGDVDFHSLGIPAADSRVFALVDGAAASTNDFDLRVTTERDTLEYDDSNNDTPFGAVAPNVSGTPLDGSASYLRVTHYSAFAQAEPYRIYAAIQPALSSATPEVEPNDSLALATGGTSGYFSGGLSSSADLDLFSLTAVAGDLIQIGLDLDPTRNNTPFNGSLALLDSSGMTLMVVNDPASSSNRSTGAGTLSGTSPNSPGEAMIYRIRSSGTYYVKVAWISGAAGDYLLSVAHDCRVGPPTDLALSQTDAPDPVAPGGNVTYTMTVHNAGTEQASVVSLRDEPPAGALLVSATPTQGVCLGTGPVICHLGDLAPGASAAVVVVVAAPGSPGELTNSALISSAVIDPISGNNTISESTTVGSVDSDGDGVPDASDCAPADSTTWAVPGEAADLMFPDAADPGRLQWGAPSSAGGTMVRYDLIRSAVAASFQPSACLASDLTITTASDPLPPATTFYYLVRSENTCGGNLGTSSDGTPRSAGPCP